MLSIRDLTTNLGSLFQDDLPGFTAQSDMMPEGRIKLPEYSDLQRAAVLIAFFPRENGWYFPLFRRVADGYAHSGQVGLPGGRAEDGESPVETALREAQEEVGINPDDVILCGQLSALPIPLSGYLVHPFLGALTSEPAWQLESREVDELLLVSLQDFLREEAIQAEKRRFKGQDWTIPYFDLEGHKVWGATAMILSELRALMSNLQPAVLDEL